MRLLYSFPHPLGSAGIGTTAFEQVRSVAKLGVQVAVYCTSLERPLPGVRVVETLAVAGRRIPHRAIGVPRAYRYHDLRVALALRRGWIRPDIVHCWPRAASATLNTARSRGVIGVREVPNTHTAHAFEVIAAENARVGVQLPRGHSHRYSARRLAKEEEEYRLSDFLLVSSEYVRSTFLARGTPAEKLVLHRYGFDPESFRFPPPPRDEARPFTAAFVGRCEPRKGLHYALRAWLDSGAAGSGRFLICGQFVPAYKEFLAPMLSHRSVEVLGWVANTAEVLQRSDVLLLPSIEEGSALVTYEAQAAGCVLLVSEAAGARCQHGESALVHPPGDVGTLTSHLRAMATDTRLLKRLRKATLGRVASLTWDSAGVELARRYEAMLNRRSSGEDAGDNGTEESASSHV